MMSKKKKTSYNFENFLPVELQTDSRFLISELNVLAALCFFWYRFSEHVSNTDGWFYCSQKNIIEHTGDTKKEQVGRTTLNSILTKFRMLGLIKTKPGTNHKCTWYKLSPKIEELLQQN